MVKDQQGDRGIKKFVSHTPTQYMGIIKCEPPCARRCFSSLSLRCKGDDISRLRFPTSKPDFQLVQGFTSVRYQVLSRVSIIRDWRKSLA